MVVKQKKKKKKIEGEFVTKSNWSDLVSLSLSLGERSCTAKRREAKCGSRALSSLSVALCFDFLLTDFSTSHTVLILYIF